MVVHIDADTGSVEQRQQQLADALQTAEESSREPAERIAIVVPWRNVETWLYGLTGLRVDETYDFKRDSENRIAVGDRKRADERIGPAAQELYRLTRPNAPPPAETLPALAAAVIELRRLEN